MKLNKSGFAALDPFLTVILYTSLIILGVIVVFIALNKFDFISIGT